MTGQVVTDHVDPAFGGRETGRAITRGPSPARSMALRERKNVPDGTSTSFAAPAPARSMALWARKKVPNGTSTAFARGVGGRCGGIREDQRDDQGVIRGRRDGRERDA